MSQSRPNATFLSLNSQCWWRQHHRQCCLLHTWVFLTSGHHLEVWLYFNMKLLQVYMATKGILKMEVNAFPSVRNEDLLLKQIWKLIKIHNFNLNHIINKHSSFLLFLLLMLSQELCRGLELDQWAWCHGSIVSTHVYHFASISLWHECCSTSRLCHMLKSNS